MNESAPKFAQIVCLAQILGQMRSAGSLREQVDCIAYPADEVAGLE